MFFYAVEVTLYQLVYVCNCVIILLKRIMGTLEQFLTQIFAVIVNPALRGLMILVPTNCCVIFFSTNYTVQKESLNSFHLNM